MTEKMEKYETPAQKVISFFSEELSLPPEKINMTSRLRQDLGLNGAEAVDLLEAYALTFGIDIDSFRMNDYFGPDAGIGPFWANIMWVFGNSRPLKTLTIVDLVKAFEKGKLE